MSSNADANSNSNSAPTEPSMLHGHAQFVSGAVTSALGYDSGAQTKEAGLEEMRAAKSEEKPEPSGVLGKVEGVLGTVVGCEGMQEEGERRKGAEERLV